MKRYIQIMVMLFCVTAFAQEQKVESKKIENGFVQVTYYFADNSNIVEREGFFNEDGKLHGTWINYDILGNKTVIANYDNGKKVGTWTYFKGDKINVVTYDNNKIVAVETKDLVLN
jgi:antitoxin component YwqK of YwqJK toxin-antitoxin module